MKLFCVIISLFFIVVDAQRSCTQKFNNVNTGVCLDASSCRGSSAYAEVCEARTCCINDTGIPTNPPSCINQALFTQVYNTTRGAYIGRVLNYAVYEAGICDNCRAKAAFLAIAATMTNNFLFDEAIGTDASFAGDNQRYGNSGTGEGSQFRQRGFFRVRGKDFYERFQSVNPAYRIREEPAIAANPVKAAEIAARLWRNPTLVQNNPVPLTAHADGTFYGLSMLWYKLTGGVENLPEIAKRYSYFLRLFQCGGDLYPGQGARCIVNGTTQGYCVPMCISGMEDIGEVCGCSGNTASTCGDGPRNIVCCTDACSQELKMDLGLVLDSSGSITAPGYELLRAFVKDLLRQVNVGANKTHVGIINYSTQSYILTRLNQQYTLSEKLVVMDRAPFLNSGTNTAAALQQANSIFNAANGLRKPEEGATQVIFVITDGESSDERATVAAAAVLKQKGIHVISVGIGDRLRLSELNAMCTPPSSENYFAIADYQSLSNRLNQFLSKSCSEPAVIPSNTTVTSEVGGGKYKFFKLKIVVKGNKVMVKVKLMIGNVKLYFSFTSRNPKDPKDFLNYPTTKIVSEDVDSEHSSVSGLFGQLKQSWISNEKTSQTEEKLVTLVIDKPADIENFDSVNVGVKGSEAENQFELSLEDCELVLCPSGTIISSRLNLLLGLFCLLLSVKLW